MIGGPDGFIFATLFATLDRSTKSWICSGFKKPNRAPSSALYGMCGTVGSGTVGASIVSCLSCSRTKSSRSRLAADFAALRPRLSEPSASTPDVGEAGCPGCSETSAAGAADSRSRYCLSVLKGGENWLAKSNPSTTSSSISRVEASIAELPGSPNAFGAALYGVAGAALPRSA